MGPMVPHISRGARDVMIETSSRRRCGEINMALLPGQKILGSGTLGLRDFWEG